VFGRNSIAMPTCIRSTVGTAAALVYTAHAAVEPPQWILGAAQQACSAVCAASGLHCIGGDWWPTNTIRLLKTSQDAGNGVSGCKDAIRRDYKYAPSKVDGECFYQPDQSKIECNAAPPSNTQRYCPCGKAAPQFMLADANISCTDYCAARGGVCSSDPGEFPTTAPTLAEMVAPLGMSCSSSTAVSTEPFHAPSINGDHCYFPQAATLTRCDAKMPMHRRFCPCLGASYFGGSTVDEGSRTGHISSRLSGHTHGQGGCRFGGFKMGMGTGGSRREVPGALDKDQCRERVLEYCPEASGATFQFSTKTCWCEIGMSSYATMDDYTVCWFTDGTITSGAGSILGGYSAGESVVAGASTSTIGAAMLVAAASGAVAVLGLVGWRFARRDQAASGEASSALCQLEEAD